jgi:RNA polymerase sigma-70 factor (ECF subfamily)
LGETGAETDLELLETWRAGETAAGDELLKRHFSSVVRYFESHLRGSAQGTEPRDLAQRTFEACIAGRDRVQTDFRGYLFGIARHELIREWKRRRDTGPLVTPSEAGVPHPGTSPSRAVARVDEQRLLLEVLERLPLEYSSVLVRFFWEERTIAEIARDLGVAPGTVKSRLFRGKALLKEHLLETALPRDVRESATSRLDARAVDADDD